MTLTMALHTTDQDIKNRINSFLTELSGLVRKAALEAVHEVLAGTGTTRRRRGPGRPRGTAKRRPGRPRTTAVRAKSARGGKRTSEQVEAMAARVLAHVKANAGHRLEQISQGIRVATKELKLPVIKLIAAKKLRTEGRKRGTKYFAGARRAKKSRGKAKARTRGKVKRSRKVSRKRGTRRAAKASAPAAQAVAVA